MTEQRSEIVNGPQCMCVCVCVYVCVCVFFIIYFGSMLHYLCNTTCYYIHSLFTLLLLYVRFYVLLVFLLKLVNVY